jgi:hypothetical protein
MHYGVLNDPSDQGPVWQGDVLVSKLNRHHRGGDQGAKVDEGLTQESVEIALNGDPSVTQHRVYPIGQDMIKAPNIIAEVTQLEIALSFCLHLVRAPLCETLHHLSTSGKMIYWPQVD